MPATPPHPALAVTEHLLPALRSFPDAIRAYFPNAAAWTSLEAHKHFYASADPVHSAVSICTALTAYVYIMQQLTGNASQVDGLWTFLPLVYTAHFTFQPAIGRFLEPPVSAKVSRFFGSKTATTAAAAEEIAPRLLLIFVLQCLWSARLTFNAYRRGMFKKGEEDYRWPLLRASMSRWQWELLSIFFIAAAQNVLLALPGLGSYIISSAAVNPSSVPLPNPPSKLIAGDYLLAGLLVLNLTIQFIADQQQWVYQNFKRGRDASEKALSEAAKIAPDAPYTQDDVKRGFVTKGLWAFSRHPNFACEQTTWWILYLFVPLTFYPTATSAAAPAWHYFVTYAISAPLAMNALFIASTLYSEGVSAKKYPEYADYQRRVGMFWPWDTALRSVYYGLIASDAARERVKANVWGKPVAESKKKA